MDELVVLAKKWQLHNETHSKRHVGIIQRQTRIAQEWLDAVKKYPANSEEIKVEINRLWKQLGNLYEETKEVYLDMASDNEMLAQVIVALQKEIKKLPDEQDEQN